MNRHPFLNVTANSFDREPQSLRTQQAHAIERVIKSGWWILGEEVKSFEDDWSKFSGSSFSVGMSNGLDAIEIGLRSLGVQMGDEVITTPVTAFATTLAIQRCGAIPVFADIDIKTGCLDVASVESCITSRTKAIIVVHLYGRIANVTELLDVCRSNNIDLLEDCAQSHGAKLSGKGVGTFGSLAAWSFYPTKNLGAIGDAGAITTNSLEIASKCRSLRNYGQSNRYYHDLAGGNCRLDEIQAAVLQERLKFLNLWNTRRREIASLYRTFITNPIMDHLESEEDPESNVHHLFVLTTSERDRVVSEFELSQVQINIHYPVPGHLQKALSEYRLAPGGVPNSIQHCNTCFSLPINPYLTDTEIEYVIEVANSIRC